MCENRFKLKFSDILENHEINHIDLLHTFKINFTLGISHYDDRGSRSFNIIANNR